MQREMRKEMEELSGKKKKAAPVPMDEHAARMEEKPSAAPSKRIARPGKPLRRPGR